jgi:hypothetical protein
MTPPMGAPKATATPAADDAAYISLIEKADFERRKRRDMVCPAQTATWTLGPSLPTLKPDAIANGKEIVFIARLNVNLDIEKEGGWDVVNPKNPFMMNPAIIHFISEIPLPAA